MKNESWHFNVITACSAMGPLSALAALRLSAVLLGSILVVYADQLFCADILPRPVAKYEFDADVAEPVTSVTPFESTDGEHNSTASNISTGSFVLGSPIGNPAPSLFHDVLSWMSRSEAEALAEGNYIEFSVVADVSKRMNIFNLDFDIQRDTAQGLDSWALYVDTDSSDGLDDFLRLLAAVATPFVARNSWQHSVIVFPGFGGMEFEDLEAIAVRIYLWHQGDVLAGASVDSRTDNIVLNGVVVSEPSTLRLSCVALCGFAGLVCERGKR